MTLLSASEKLAQKRVRIRTLLLKCLKICGKRLKLALKGLFGQELAQVGEKISKITTIAFTAFLTPHFIRYVYVDAARGHLLLFIVSMNK